MKMLFLGAHADDIEMGCGGTISKHVRLGKEIKCIVCAACSRQRIIEQHEAFNVLGLSASEWDVLNFDDGRLSHSVEMVSAIEKHVEWADVIFAPYYNDTHQDHMVVSRVVMSASRRSKSLLLYEDISTIDFMPSFFSEITNEDLEKKITALSKHISQNERIVVSGYKFTDIARVMAQWRGFQSRAYPMAEAFHAVRFSGVI